MFAANQPCRPVAHAVFSTLLALLALHPSQAGAAAAATTTTLAITSGTGTVTSVSSGTAVTLTATVKAGTAAVPLGVVKFCDASAAHCTDIHLLGTGLLSAGSAVFKFVPGPGVHSYKAEFAGTTADAASSSAAASLTVGGAPTTTTIAQSGSAGNYTLRATVTGKGSLTGPTGNVTFLDTSFANAVLGTAALGTSTESFNWTTPQSPATAADPQSIVVADFNGDGIPDLAVATNGTTATKNIGSIDILLGNGDGTFQAAKTYAGLTGEQFIVAAPFVTGGPQDIFAVSNSSTGNNNAMFLIGDGKGGFTVEAPFSLGGTESVSALIAGDFSGDGKEDFIVAGTLFGIPEFDVYLGNGNGTFNGGTVNATSSAPITALGGGDFTGDGALDLAVVHSDGTVDIFVQDGLGDFSPNAGTQAGSSPTAIAIGDFNGDGKADLAIANSGNDNVSILLGNGSGGFTAIASPPTGSTPSAIAIGDFNVDGIPDLAVANRGGANVTILLGKGDGTFSVEAPLDTGNTPVSLATGRFNGEDTADIAVANQDPAASTSTGTATILLSQLSETATATASGIAPAAAGTHLVDASYAGNTLWHTSLSVTTSLTGSGKQAVAPILSPAAGTYTTAQTITLTDATPGATIYYTTNGTTPTTASTKYTAGFKVTSTTSIEAIATATGYAPSIVASAKYTIASPTATPTFSVAAGTYTATQSVTLKDTTTGAVLYYTLNGTTPTTASTKYSTAIAVTASETIKAIAVAVGYANSAVASAAYVIETPAATPTFSVAAGTYGAAQSVTLKDTTTGAVLYYTTNGATPTTASTKYTAAIAVSASETIKAIAVATGHTNSAVATATYTIEHPAATPTFSVPSGTYSTTQSVQIADATPGATIYYTTNGNTPTTASTKYTGPISVASTETIKAIATAAGDTNSAVASAAYTIGYPIATFVATASGTNVLTVPVGGEASFSVASENQSGQSYSSVIVKTTTGTNPSLPVQVTLCASSPSTGQCLAAPAATVTVAPFANGATPTFSVFVTATAAIASSPNNQVDVIFTNPSGTTLGAASVPVVTN